MFDNRRLSFRLEFINLQGHISGDNIDATVEIKNISDSGIAFTHYETSISDNLLVEFKLSGETIRREVNIIRRKPHSDHEYLFACSFLDQTEVERGDLLNKLLQEDSKRYKNKKGLK